MAAGGNVCTCDVYCSHCCTILANSNSCIGPVKRVTLCCDFKQHRSQLMYNLATSSLPEWFDVPTLCYAEPARERCHAGQPLSALWLLAAQEKQELSQCLANSNYPAAGQRGTGEKDKAPVKGQGARGDLSNSNWEGVNHYGMVCPCHRNIYCKRLT